MNTLTNFLASRSKPLLVAYFCALFLFCTGCDNRPSIPPTCAGTGTVMFFRVKNDNGTEIYDRSLNDYLSAHPEMKILSQTPIGGVGNNEMKMVIMQVAPGATPPPINDPNTMAVEK